jgi:hypothetical protein
MKATSPSQTRHDTARNTMPLIRADEISRVVAYMVLALAAYLLPLVLYQIAPVTYVRLITEDSFAEWGTVVAWLGVATMVAALLVREPDLRGPGMVMLAIVAVFLAGEEMSWGQRLLGIAPPRFFQSHNRQGELNFHNLVRASQLGLINVAIASWSFVASPLALVWAPMRRLFAAFAVPIVPLYLAPCFLVALLFITLTGTPDHLTRNVTELGECYLAVAALLLVLHIAYSRRGRQAASSRCR